MDKKQVTAKDNRAQVCVDAMANIENPAAFVIRAAYLERLVGMYKELERKRNTFEFARLIIKPNPITHEDCDAFRKEIEPLQDEIAEVVKKLGL